MEIEKEKKLIKPTVIIIFKKIFEIKFLNFF